MKTKAMILIDYRNYKGGVNNLQVAKVVVEISGRWSPVKHFTSTCERAEAYAKRWAKKEGYEVS